VLKVINFGTNGIGKPACDFLYVNNSSITSILYYWDILVHAYAMLPLTPAPLSPVHTLPVFTADVFDTRECGP